MCRRRQSMQGGACCYHDSVVTESMPCVQPCPSKATCAVCCCCAGFGKEYQGCSLSCPRGVQLCCWCDPRSAVQTEEAAAGLCCHPAGAHTRWLAHMQRAHTGTDAVHGMCNQPSCRRGEAGLQALTGMQVSGALNAACCWPCTYPCSRAVQAPGSLRYEFALDF